MNNEILLSNLLRTDQEEFRIHDIKEIEGLIYFKINNHQFQTTGSWVYHKNHVMYDLAPTKIYAKSQGTEEGLIKSKLENEEFDKRFDLFMKHRVSLYKLIFIRALKDFSKDDKKFLDYIDYHFDITENSNGCQKLIKMLELAEKK